MQHDVDVMIWALLKVRQMVSALGASPKLADGMVIVRGPDGSSYMLHNSNINTLPACARRVDCSLIVARADGLDD